MNTKDFIRVLLADDHTLFRSGIINLLQDGNNIFVVGEVENGNEVAAKYFDVKPDIVLLDISMPGKSGFEAAKEIILKDENAKILFLSMHEGDEYIYLCLKAGGKGLINKSITKGELILAVKRIVAGEFYFSNNLSEQDAKRIYNNYEKTSSKKPLFTKDLLTQREEAVFKLIGNGMTSNEIAKSLDISRRTVDTYRASIMQKLKIKNLPELIKHAIRYQNEQ